MRKPYRCFSAFIISLCACSTAEVRVLAGSTNNQVVALDHERAKSEIAAIDAADKYCSKQGKKTIVLEKKTNYQGSMDEGARTAMGVAGTAMMFAPSDPLVTGAGFGLRQASSGLDYKSEIVFLCE